MLARSGLAELRRHPRARSGSLLEGHDGAGETVPTGRYLLADGCLSRDPLGGPVLNCTTQTAYRAAGAPAWAVQLRSGRRVVPTLWMAAR